MTGYRKFMAWGSVNPAGGRVNRPGFLAPRVDVPVTNLTNKAFGPFGRGLWIGAILGIGPVACRL